MANLFLVSFLLVAAGIVFLLYGPTRRARPIVAVPRASLGKIQLPPSAHVVALSPPPPAAETEIGDDMIVPGPAPVAPTPRPAVAPPLHHGFVPVVNSKGPLPPLRSRAARGTDSPRRPVAETAPTTVREFTTEEATRIEDQTARRRS